MTCDLKDIIRRANEAYFASQEVEIPKSIKKGGTTYTLLGHRHYANPGMLDRGKNKLWELFEIAAQRELSLKEKYRDKIIDHDPPDRYGMTEEERADDPRRGQADAINRERDGA